MRPHFPHFLFLLIFGCVMHASHAEPLTQTTISVRANGKPVGGMIFPIGVKITPSVAANREATSGTDTTYTGNVQGRFTPPAGQQIILFGEQLVVSQQAISPGRAKAVRDLEEMATSDQLYRGLSVTGNLTPDQWKQQTAIDVANMRRLAEIIDAYGWPGLHVAGAASQTAFLVLQHADQASQHRYLPAMRAAVERNDALAGHLAMLEDRVRLADGKPQLYGSQLKPEPLGFEPIEDEVHVDERRRSIGLAPLADYAKNFGLHYTPKQAAHPAGTP
jgi:hypothetical protein